MVQMYSFQYASSLVAVLTVRSRHLEDPIRCSAPCTRCYNAFATHLAPGVINAFATHLAPGRPAPPARPSRTSRRRRARAAPSSARSPATLRHEICRMCAHPHTCSRSATACRHADGDKRRAPSRPGRSARSASTACCKDRCNRVSERVLRQHWVATSVATRAARRTSRASTVTAVSSSAGCKCRPSKP
jgi:hypothetical protein